MQVGLSLRMLSEDSWGERSGDESDGSAARGGAATPKTNENPFAQIAALLGNSGPTLMCYICAILASVLRRG